ncbi:MAG: condensation domain-containing protein [Oscillospiraceae bacterium]|nr:condensation domain-containing protein [Oscillospiraceae bacterium]MDY2510599.1 condensation domain-containing protein [Ruminococcus callidus]
MKEFTIHGTVMQCYPLTAAQRLHYYTIRYCPRHQVLNIGTGLYIQIDLDFNLLREVIYQAYERQDSMRVRFLQDEDGTVYQYVVPFEEREIPFYDFSHWKEEDAHAEMRKWTAVPFKRYHSPMNRVVMVKLPDGYNGIYLKVDHMTMDSSSIIGFHRDVLELYCAKRYGTNVPKPMQSYLKAIERDLVYENDSPAKKKDEAFWKQEIAKSEPMYTDFTGMGRLLTQRRETNNPDLRNAIITSSSLDAAISVYHLEADPSDRLMQFCLDNQVPMASLLLMGLRTVLSKFNNNEKDVSVKTNVARRGTLLEKHSGGTRIHFFPLRTIMEPDMTFLDGIKMIQTEQNRIFRHANYDPIAVTMMRSKRWKMRPGASYESISLTYQPLTLRQKDTELPNIAYKSLWYSNGVAAQPLYLTVMHRVEDNGLNFNFEYKKDVVTEQEMEYLYYYLCRVLFRGIENKNRTIGEILEMI